MKLLVIAIALFTLRLSATAADVTPAQWLAAQPKPVFKAGHKLLPLTRYGWDFPSNVVVELADNWGYAVDLGRVEWSSDYNFTYHLTNSSSQINGLVNLVSNNPTKYKLAVVTSHDWLTPIPDDFYVTNAAGWFIDRRDSAPFQYRTNGWLTISPEAGADYLALASSNIVWPITLITNFAPVAILLNGGEYGLNTFAGEGGYQAWLRDPRVNAKGFDTNTVTYQNTNWLPFIRYASERKARELGFLTSKIAESFPNHLLSVFYHTGAEENRWYGSGMPQFLNYYSWDSDLMNTNVTLPNWEIYFNGTWTNAVQFGQTNYLPLGTPDLLTRYLNAVGWDAHLRDETNYSGTNYTWVTRGWEWNLPYSIASASRYAGLLKCMYIGGMIGGNEGQYSFPTGGFNASFDPENPPYWLPSLVAIARVHAQFTHLEDYIWNGKLLAGPSKHGMATDQPAYEFTNNAALQWKRVLARKHNARAEWLVCAWAQDGVEANVTVSIPDLGEITVTASEAGELYSAIPGRVSLLNALGRRVDAKEMIVQGSMTINR